MDFSEKKIDGKCIYKGRVVTLNVDRVSLPDGSETVREVCLHPGGVAILPLTADGDVICVRQHRYPYHTELIEIPAGKLENGEEPKACGIRELREETGYSAGEVIPLGCAYPSPGYLDEKLYLYLARDLHAGEASPDEGEYLSVLKIPFDELLNMVMDDKIHDAKTVIAVLKTAILLGKK